MAPVGGHAVSFLLDGQGMLGVIKLLNMTGHEYDSRPLER